MMGRREAGKRRPKGRLWGAGARLNLAGLGVLLVLSGVLRLGGLGTGGPAVVLFGAAVAGVVGGALLCWIDVARRNAWDEVELFFG